MHDRVRVPIDMRLARLAFIAIFALIFVVAGTNGRFVPRLPGPAIAGVAGTSAPQAPAETSGEPPHLDASYARLAELQGRLRQAAPRRATAAHQATPAGSHLAALNGAAFALAIAARARERQDAQDRPQDLHAARPIARGPPLLS